MKSFVGYLSMISMGVIASVVLANGTLGPQGVMGALSGINAGQSASGPASGPASGTPVTPPISQAGTGNSFERGVGDDLHSYGAAGPTFKLDYASLILGLVIGVLLSSLASVPWSQIPRRSANWLVSNQANFGYGLLSIAFAALLIYY